jgi:cephalosporin-C deacetylase-like acetyl esterase
MKLTIALLTIAALAAAQSPPPPLNFLTGQVDGTDMNLMLPRYLKARAFKMLDDRREQVSRIASRQSLASRRAEFREKFWRNLGGMPERTSLNARIVGAIEKPDYRIEKVIFESQPGFFVTANLYLPKTVTGKLPAILFPLGHEDGAKAHDAWQHVLVSFARRGFVCLAWDTLGQGERIQMWDDDFKQSKAIRSTTEHTLLGLQTVLVGDALARYTIWDGMRALDYLISRPEVDPTRIGVTGNSGGGTHSSYLGALDDRLAVIAPSCYLTNWRRLLETIGPQDAEQCVPNSIAEGLDHPDFVLAAAPKPYMMLVAIRDFFSIAGARETFGEAERVYDSIGEATRFGKFEWDDGHGYSRPRREAAYRWFSRWLQNKEDTAPETPVEVLDEQELWCTSQGQVALAFRDANKTVFDLNQDRFTALRPRSPQPDNVRKLIGFAPATGMPRVRNYGLIEANGYSIEKLVYEPEPGILVPALLYEPAGVRGKLPATILVFGAGKASAREEAEKLVKSGSAALAIDVRGLGETRAIPEKYGSDWPRYFGDYESSMTALLTGKPLVSMRAEDIVRAVDLLSIRPEIDAARITGHGRELGAIPLLYAAAFDTRLTAITLERSVRSYESIIRNRIHRQQWENAVTGALRHFDLPDLEGWMQTRKVTWVDPVYPNGQLMPRSLSAQKIVR